MASRPYEFSNVPEVGETIVFVGLDRLREGTVTQFRHVETPPYDPFNRWGVFVETADGPAFVNDYRYLWCK